jgi:hemolysin-activating ACP:hemolysin acyltransferase
LSEDVQGSPGRIRLELGTLNERNLLAVLSMVSRYPPFAAYSFGLMVNNLSNQLRHGASVLAIDRGRLVGYAGWLRVDEAQAGLWQTGARGIPDEDWQHGRAAIVTVTVAERPALLAPILHAISDVCAGLPVYRMRSFQDGRPDIRRPPITGRKWRFQTSPG